jgi:trigger factor
MARQQATRMARQGRDVKSFDIANFREENRALAEKRVRGLLILDAIAEKEKVEVTEQEISSALAMMARTSGQPVEAIKTIHRSTAA